MVRRTGDTAGKRRTPLVGAHKHRVDPYLVWADATGYAYDAFVKDVATLIVEVKAAKTLTEFEAWARTTKWIRVSVAYAQLIDSSGNCPRFCTAHVFRKYLPNLLSEIGIGDFWTFVERFELAASVAPNYPIISAIQTHRAPSKATRAAQIAYLDALAGSRGNGQANQDKQKACQYLGVVDIAIPYANASWRDRLCALWDQQEGLVGPKSSVGYGREWQAGPTPIEPLMNVFSVSDEQTSYHQFEFPLNLNRRTHGAAVVSQLTSTAREVDYLAVQMPKDALAFTARSALSAYVLDAVAWMMTIARPCDGLVVNVSLGTHAGPHDGSSIMEAALDNLIQLRRKDGVDHLAVVLAAGNSYEAQGHAIVACSPKEPTVMNWQILPDDMTPSFVEIWFPKNMDVAGCNPRVVLRSPNGEATRPTPVGSTEQIGPPSGPIASVIFPVRSAGGNDLMALLAVAPTAKGAAEAGRWQIEIHADAEIVEIHAYVERDTAMFDPSRPFGRQSYFDDQKYVKAGRLPGRIVDDGKSWIRRSGTLNSLATGTEPLVIGSYFHTWGQDPARYTSAGPSRGGKGDLPHASAVGEDGITLAGINVDGTLSGSMTRLAGTSVAAPEVAGSLASAMSKADWQTKHKSARAWLTWALSRQGIGGALKEFDPQLGLGRFPRGGGVNPHG